MKFVIGTPQSLSAYSTWQGGQELAVLKCYTYVMGDEEIRAEELTSQNYMVESVAMTNPCTGCQDPLSYCLSNTTVFEKDVLYSDPLNDDLFLRYFLTSDSVSLFEQAFPGSDLRGDPFAVACTASCLRDLGYEFIILVHLNENKLLSFCEIQKWDYEVVD